MSDGVCIRESLPTDRQILEELYRVAFPDEDLIPLLRELLNEKDDILSLVSMNDGMLTGHIVFTMCSIGGRNEKVGLLGPVAVSPDFQRQGIGSALIQEGFSRLKSEGTTQVQVLGDPTYYGRFGFEPDSNVTPPYDLPQEWKTAWQSINLHGVKPSLVGALRVPKPWLEPTLWGP